MSNVSDGWLVSRETETIEVKNSTGKKATVELFRMNEGDRQDRENAMMRSRQKKGQKGADVAYQIGALRQFDFVRLIAGWSLPFPVSKSTLAQLEPSIAEQIHAEIRRMNPFVFDDGDDEEGAENPTSPATEAEKSTD